jgi:hypothetical protein
LATGSGIFVIVVKSDRYPPPLPSLAGATWVGRCGAGFTGEALSNWGDGIETLGSFDGARGIVGRDRAAYRNQAFLHLGTPLGSLWAQFAAGADSAAPIPARLPKSTRMIGSARQRPAEHAFSPSCSSSS